MNFSDADLYALLAATGDTCTLGSVTVACVVHAADLEQLQISGQPVSVISKALSVTVKTGALALLKPGATVVIKTVSYTVNQPLRTHNGQLTRFLAFPV